MRGLFKVVLASGLFLLASNTFAQDEEEVLDTSWNGVGEFGFVSTTGNTDTQSLNLRLEFKKATENWRFRLAGAALSSSKNGDKDAERYQAEMQADRKLNAKSYLFGVYRYDADKFGAYDPQQSITAGYGRELMKSETHVLNGEIGVGYKKSKAVSTGVTDNEMIGRFLLEDAWSITPSTAWNNRLLVELGSDNTFTQFNTGLVVSMNDRFALKLGWEYRHNSEIPVGVTDKTDTTTTANLVYNF
jgi:putative salt-induced outer membrane protein